jgi:uroporphyrinogen decarboxylase
VLAFPLPDPDEFAAGDLEADALALTARADKPAIVVFGLDGGIFEMSCRLRGFEQFFLDLAGDRRLASCLLERVLEFKIARWGALLRAAGSSALVVLESDDLGTQRGPVISPALYRELIKPLHRRLFAAIRQSAADDVFLLLHSCGSVVELVPDYIDLGVDALNPLQSTAAGMDPALLKRRFGSALAFWGGGVATQTVLPYGKPDQVRDQVRERIEVLSPGGGFVFAPEHNIQPDVPIENLVAMWETFSEHAQY